MCSGSCFHSCRNSEFPGIALLAMLSDFALVADVASLTLLASPAPGGRWLSECCLDLLTIRTLLSRGPVWTSVAVDACQLPAEEAVLGSTFVPDARFRIGCRREAATFLYRLHSIAARPHAFHC